MIESLLIEGMTASSFSVDGARRTMTGVVVPWGAIGRHADGRRWRFRRGSLRYAAAKYLRLNDEHVARAVLGRGAADADTDEGLVLAFRLYDGPAGDRALRMAMAGEKTGLSVEIEFDDLDAEPDPDNPGVLLVNEAHLTAVGFTQNPAFTDARLISVTASRHGGTPMRCDICGQTHAEGVPACAPAPTAVPPAPPAVVETPAAAPVTFSADQFDRLMGRLEAAPPAAAAARPVVDPTRAVPAPAAQVREPLPYRFNRDDGRTVFHAGAENDLSTDIFLVMDQNAAGPARADAERRVNALIRAAFADVETADVTALNPNAHRPDLWQPQRDYATPLWDMVGAGTTDGRTFDVPKFTSASGQVGPATEKVEPAAGSFVAELQTVTPTQVWGKVEITRQAWRKGGSPQLSGILWDQMLREYYEDREAAVATFLNTLTAAADITLTGTPLTTPDNDDDQVTVNDLEMALADLQFARGGNRFRAFAAHQALYRVLARVKDDAGRPLYPMISPSNANGTTESLYSTINVGGTRAVPAYALGAPALVATNSWLFDPAVVLGWASAPERLFWDFGATVQTANIPQLSFVTLGIYGDVAMANLDISGVRQVIFDPSV